MSENQSLIDLPVPDQEALEHSQRLGHRIRQEIEHHGHISFSRFMEMSLYEPGMGYYSAGARKFGEAGDFITAPELSILFTECLARQCIQILSQFRHPCILEAGPGSGIMMCDLLTILEKNNSLPEKYYVLESSADLRGRQKSLVHEKISHLENRIEWLDHLTGRPFDGLVIGNEILDALPVNRLVFRDGCFRELCVNLVNGDFTWIEMPLPETLQKQVALTIGKFTNELPEGYRTELNLRSGSWIQSISGLLNQGAVLLIDYGYSRREYYHPQRTDGTLLCHYRHHVHHDPFLYPGLQDITASVDFTTVAEAGVSAGMQVKGYTTQAHFLVNCDLQEVMEENSLTPKIDRVELGRQVRILTMPGEMGERFKVIALTKNFDIPLKGFGNFDQRHHL